MRARQLCVEPLCAEPHHVGLCVQDTAWNQSDVIRADNLLALEAGCSALLACVQDTDPENADPSRRAGSPALRLHAFDLDQHRWSAVHAAGSISFQKLEALECHGSKLIAVGWSGGKSESDMQVGSTVATLDLHLRPVIMMFTLQHCTGPAASRSCGTVPGSSR